MFPSGRQPQIRQPSNFQTRTATDEAGELRRRGSQFPEEQPSPSPAERPRRLQSDSSTDDVPNPYQPDDGSRTPPPRNHSFTKRLLHLWDRPRAEEVAEDFDGTVRKRSSSARRKARMSHTVGDQPSVVQTPKGMDETRTGAESLTPKPGLGPRPIGGHKKLGTFSGVFVPTCLNVLSILMFLRFGFILGQAGLFGTMGMLIVAYIINLITTFSLSAIATNGTVRGGGAYYLISRSLGPEFGGAIGVVFYLGFAFNTGLNAVGLIDCIKNDFGAVSGDWYRVLPEGVWLEYLWATLVLLICTGICLAGSSIFARASNGLLVVLLIATFSIPISALVVAPFEDRVRMIEYTGLNWQTFKANFWPQLIRGAAGSQLEGKETFQDLFGILFPATGGIFAGASMSGDLKHPSKAIPKGTLYGLGLTFVAYTLVIFAMAATITRASFVRNLNVIQDSNISSVIVLAGEFASSFFSTLMGVIGSAKLLQALARDKLIPGLSVFGQGTKKGDEPTFAILITYVVAQVTMLCNINQIASFVTMTYLMTFLVMNLATFLLKIGSAPNFRPSFHFFSWQTALAGTIGSGAAMFFVDGSYATGCVGILLAIFLLIHYTSAPRSWGDVSQSLIYHQVRKYLLRLRQEHVKFWRPQILLFVNDPRRQYKLIQFCNSMKKGALYILGHVIVSQDFGGSVPEARRQQTAWMKFIEYSRIKAFISIAISPGLEWGARNIVLGAGLGGMRPNIAVLGFYNLDDLRRSKPLIDVSDNPGPNTPSNEMSQEGWSDRRVADQLPTDACRTESMISVTSYVTILEDLLLRLQINVALARGFQELEFPRKIKEENTKKYIDLWPIQMSAEIAAEGDHKTNVLTTNFDTYTLILQLGCILDTVPAWKKAYTLRVAVFVEYETDVEEERGRVKALLGNLRIEAEILVFWLACGDLYTYEIIVNGQSPGLDSEQEVDECLKDQDWWEEIQRIRGKRGVPSSAEDLADVRSLYTTASVWPESSFQQGPREERVERFLGLRKLLKKSKRRHTMSGITRLGVSLGMRTQKLQPQIIGQNKSYASASEDSGSSSSSEGDSDTDALETDDEDDRKSVDRESAATEGDMDDYESESDTPIQSPAKLTRRRSHGDSMRGPPPSKKSTGEKEPQIPQPVSRRSPVQPSADSPSSDAPSKPATIPNRAGSSSPLKNVAEESESVPADELSSSFKRLEERFSALRASTPKSSPLLKPQPRAAPPLSNRPSFSRHASLPKFSSKPVPITRVATEDGPGPSIMFTDTPSPPARRNRLPSAYRPGDQTPAGEDHDPQNSAAQSANPADTPTLLRRGSSYSTASIPLSFNDLPCRAQHLILNELMRSQSADTAVLFTTLPSPVEGTCKDEKASEAYLSDLEVLVRGCPPALMVHSNSMTVTVSL